MSEERLPPERRFRLYSRLAEIFRDAGMGDAENSAREEARQAMKESPEVQAELGRLLDGMREKKP